MGLLENLKDIARAIAASMGGNCETVVHDAEKKIVYIENGHISGREVGNVMEPSVFEYLESRGKQNGGYVVRLTRKDDGELLKSTTVMFYDENGEYAGMLCFSINLTEINQARNVLDAIMNVRPFEDQEHLEANLSILDYTHLVISDIIKDVGKPSTLGAKEIKLCILRKLDEKGVFLMKDAVPQVCEMLDVSQATLYNYLREIRAKSGSLIPPSLTKE